MPTVRSSVSDRLSTLSQQILSRTHLEKVIKELDLFSGAIGTVPMEGIVEAMRQSITIQVQRARGGDVQNTFTISYEGKDPEKVMIVTNRLASLFIEENLKSRERKAVGTSEFLERELSSLEVALKEKEEDIRAYKERYMGELPGQLDANLRILERLQDQMKSNEDAQKAAEERRILLQSQISQLSMEAFTSPGGEVLGETPPMIQLNQLKAQLNRLQSLYTEKHPDVIDTKAHIARLENAITNKNDAYEGADSPGNLSALNPTVARLSRERANIESEIRRLKSKKGSLAEQFAIYQQRVENTPRREQELATLTRDYNLFRSNYQSLLNKKIQARLAENLERRQMGEQFKILDPARLPEKPFKPDRKRIMLIGAFLGFVFGGGLAYMKETIDQSFRKVEEMEDFLGLSVIASIPRIES